MSQLGRTNTLAVISLLFGILGWTALPLIGGIVAIITGHIARKEIRQSGGVEDGDGLATAGIVLGWVSIAAGLLFIMLAFLLFVGAGTFGLLLLML